MQMMLMREEKEREMKKGGESKGELPNNRVKRKLKGGRAQENERERMTYQA